VGIQTCTIVFQNATILTCSLPGLETNSQPISVSISGLGKALINANVTMSGKPGVSSVYPSLGSVNGGQTVTLTGNGFSANTAVTIGGILCKVFSFSVSELVCVTQPCSAHTIDEAYPLYVKFGGQVISTGSIANFTCASSMTPVVTSISPVNGSVGDVLIVSGRNFGNFSTVSFAWMQFIANILDIF
jgi:hypothetical protein